MYTLGETRHVVYSAENVTLSHMYRLFTIIHIIQVFIAELALGAEGVRCLGSTDQSDL